MRSADSLLHLAFFFNTPKISNHLLTVLKVNLLSFAEKKIFVNQNELDETIDTGTKGFLKLLTTTEFVVIIVAAN